MSKFRTALLAGVLCALPGRTRAAPIGVSSTSAGTDGVHALQRRSLQELVPTLGELYLQDQKAREGVPPGFDMAAPAPTVLEKACAKGYIMKESRSLYRAAPLPPGHSKKPDPGMLLANFDISVCREILAGNAGLATQDAALFLLWIRDKEVEIAALPGEFWEDVEDFFVIGTDPGTSEVDDGNLQPPVSADPFPGDPDDRPGQPERPRFRDRVRFVVAVDPKLADEEIQAKVRAKLYIRGPGKSGKWTLKINGKYKTEKKEGEATIGIHRKW